MSLFGTDGIRGLANGQVLTAELALDVAVAAAHILVESFDDKSVRPRAIVGQDSRASGEFLEAAVVAGLTSAGVDVYRVGVLPTPAISFLVAAIATLASISIGLLIGLLSGYFRGRTDSVLGRFTDFLLAFPAFFMIIALSAPMIARIEKSGLARDNSARVLYLILVLALFGWPYFSRIMRSQVLSLRERDFVLASRALGASHVRIIFKELLPNLWTPVIVYLSLALPGYLAAEAVYSYLGIGVQPPAATWGLLISDSIKYIISEPTYFVIPSLSLILVVLSFNLLGDAVRDALDPKSENT